MTPINQHTSKPRKVLITGGAGFIGTNFCYYWNNKYPNDSLVIVDALTYAGIRENLSALEKLPTVQFVHSDINNIELLKSVCTDVDILVHFAAESHVDRSIVDPNQFLLSNVMGTHALLQLAIQTKIPHFHHISTDEVFGTLSLDSKELFSETTPYAPRSPYAASKASSDHLVRAYGETYGLTYTITNCSNNYGEYQFPEKLIPLAITNLLENQTVPVYGKGNQIRDWLYVRDHCSAIENVLLEGKKNETYLVGGLTESITNLELVSLLISLMGKSQDSIEFVADRPGHDEKYQVDWQKIRTELDWNPSVSLEEGLRKTIQWYTENQSWWKQLKQANESFFSKQYSHTKKPT